MFGLGMSFALARLIGHQSATADTIIDTGQTVLAFRTLIYVAFGLSGLLTLSTISTILLFWWQGKPKRPS